MDFRTSPGLLRSAASNYLTLQGLHQVVLGVMMLFLIPVMALDSTWSIRLLFLWMILLGFALWRVRVYYERRFGRVDLRTPPGFWGAGWPFLKRMVFWLPAPLILLTTHKILTPSFLTGSLMGLPFIGYFITERKPWYYLLFGLAFIVLGALGWASHTIFWIAPFAFIIAGVLDHLRLVRSFSGARQNGSARS